MRLLRLRLLRLALVACVGLGATLPAGAGADDGAPPYSEGGIPDAIEICRGNPYDIVERDGDLYVRCDGGTLTDDWRVFTTSATLAGTAATITIARAHGHGPALVSYATQPGTASAGVDYLTTSGRLYFAEGETVRTVSVPMATVAPPPGTPVRSFTVGFGDVVNLGLTVPPATVELPAVASPVPAPTIVSGPSSTTPLRSAVVAFTGEPGATFECRLDSQPFQACLSPRSLSSVGLGAHRFEVRQAIDGGTSAVAAHAWTVAGNPDPGYPGGPPYSPAGRLDGDEACDGGIYDIVVWNGNRYLNCLAGTGRAWQTFSASPATVAGASATVTVRRSSGAGAPELIGFRTQPGTAVAGTDYTAIEGELYFTAGTTERTLTIPLTRDPQATDDKRFALTFFDARRSGISVPDDVTVTIPARPEPPTITGGPQTSTVLSTASFSFSGEAGATFECRVDAAAFAACTSPKSYSSIAPGAHRFEVRQRATYGATSYATGREWTVLPSPDPGFPLGPPYAASRAPDGDYACNGGFYSIPVHNGDRYARCLGAYGLYDWQRFAPTVVVGASTATITLDRTEMAAPVLIGFATEAGTAEAGRDFTATSGELYFRDSVLSRTLTVPIARDPQASSDRSFTVRLTDSVTLGLTLPEITVTIPGNPPTSTAVPTVGGVPRVGHELTANDGGWTHAPTGYAYAWERCDAAGVGCAAIADATAATYAPVAADVGSRLRVAVTATNGSGSATERSAATAVVRTALSAPTITGGPTGDQVLHRAQFDFAGETGATFECRLDEADFAPCASPQLLTRLPAGEHRFEVRQTATDGVVSDPAARAWTVLPSPDPDYPLAPPYGHQLDADEACDGGAYALRTHNADRYVACLGGTATHAWQRFSTSVAVEGETATVTVTREAGTAAAVLRFGTEDGTARAGDDYASRSGELYFAPGVTTRTIEVPVTPDPAATVDRWFTVELNDVLDLRLRLQDGTVTIAGHAPTVVDGPTVDGVARAGETLRATDGTWTHAPTSLALSWLRCDADGEQCAPIGAASGATYVATDGDVGHRLRVAQTATNGAGSTEARSPATAVVAAAEVVPPDPGGEPGPGNGGEPGPGNGGAPGPGEQPPGPGDGAGTDPPFVVPPIGGGVPPVVPGLPSPTPRKPVRMTTVRLELRFCAGCTRPSAADRRRLQRLRARVAGSRLLAIDGYGDRGRSRSDNRRLARSRARTVERILLSGLKRRPARRTLVAHDRLVRAATKTAAADVRRGGRPAERIVTVRVVNRR